MANASSSDKWYFTKEQLENTPSRQCGYDSYKELSYRQQAANFIQDMGQKLKVSQLCINTAIVYMHRFYVFHSFTHFAWYQMAAAALFLAAKVEEQPRKLEYVIKIANICLNPRDTNVDVNSERYISQSQDLVFNENVLLQTLGFDVAIDHPHTHVVRCCHLVRASKELAQTSYFMASNSLHLTTMCIQYKPTVVACFCILVACKWTNWEFPLSAEKKEWYSYVDQTVTAELLAQLTEEFLVIFENCPSRLKEKIMALADNVPNLTSGHVNSPFHQDPKLAHRDGSKEHGHRHDGKEDPHRHRSRPHDPNTSQQQREREYKEKKERERLALQHGQKLPSGMKPPSQGHHRPHDPNMKHRPPGYPQPQPSSQQPRPFDQRGDPVRKPSSKEDQLKDPALRMKEAMYKTKHGLPEFSHDARLGMDKRMDPKMAKPREDMNKYVKPEQDIKKHMVNVHDKNSSAPYLKTTNSTSQKKSPFDASKSVPKGSIPKPNHHNGSSSSLNLPVINTEVKQEVVEPPPQPVVKRSLFSPEKTPPHKAPKPPVVHKKTIEPVGQPQPTPIVPQITAVSPLQSPVSNRSRNYSNSSSSEPELRPVMKKIDEVEGFENLMRDSTIGIKQQQDASKIVKQEVPEVKSEHPVVNSLENTPALISSLLKEGTVAAPGPVVANLATPVVEVHEKHHKSKKKNKEKHKKDKDKHREDKEKKKKRKDKEKHREKHKKQVEVVAAEPIKIKIQKDKIQPLGEAPPPIQPASGIKIKIPKDKLKTDVGETSQQPPAQSTGALKIKISKDVITNCNAGEVGKKRERERSFVGEPPQAKMPKGFKDAKQNGKHSYKVSQYNSQGQGVSGVQQQQQHQPPPQQQQYQMQQTMFSHPPPQAMFSQPPPMHGMHHPQMHPFMFAAAAQDGGAMQHYGYGYGYAGYGYPEMYQQPPPLPPQGANPPLPVDAPPAAPPPPPPE